ncbi:unnamed protein product, partial [Didymodactylos carnosus]
GRVIQLTTLKKQDENARKWLYTVWRDDRRSIKSIFYKDITPTTLPTPLAPNVRNIQISQLSIVQVKLQNEPAKNSTSLFTIEILGKENHEGGIGSRPLSSTQRAEIAKEAETLGPLNAYERNIRKADEDLLKAGN